MSVMLRAEITDVQFRELRKLAVDLERTLQQLVADALLTSPLTADTLLACEPVEKAS